MVNSNEQKLVQWLDGNTDGYYKLPMEQIAKESGTSVSVASRVLPILIAKREGVMPNEIRQRRSSNTQGRVNRKQLWKLHAQGIPIIDIAFTLDCNEDTVRRIIRTERPPDSNAELQNAAG